MTTTYVLDASVAIAAVRPSEPSHDASRRRLAALLAGIDDVVVPVLFDIEVTSGLLRGGSSPVAAEKFLNGDLASRAVVTIGPRATRAICGIVVTTRLRAADATYVWVAVSRGLPLVTLDKEIERKVAGLCRVKPP